MKAFLRRCYRIYMQLACVKKNVRYPRDLHVSRGSLIMAPRDLQIGRQVIIGMNAWIAVDGSIGNGCLISSYVGIVGRRDHDHTKVGVPISRAPWIHENPREKREVDTIVIEDDVMIGFGATLLSGIRVGRGAIVGAGSVVLQDVPPYTVVAGNPAKTVSRRFPEERVEAHEAGLEGWSW
jgi:acetyltransferase-like isoleucine patch superfamily enzyme